MSDKVEIWYTGDIVTPDGSDTGPMGDGCDPGTGATLTTGWVDPSWSRHTVYADRESVRADVYDPADFADRDDPDQDEAGHISAWVVDTIHDRIGWVELDSPDTAGNLTLYGMEPDSDPYTGVTATYACHVEGLDDAMTATVMRDLGLAQNRTFITNVDHLWSAFVRYAKAGDIDQAVRHGDVLHAWLWAGGRLPVALASTQGTVGRNVIMVAFDAALGALRGARKN